MNKEKKPIKYDEDDDEYEMNSLNLSQPFVVDSDEVEYEHIDEEYEWNNVATMMNSIYRIQKEEPDEVDDDLNEMNDMDLRDLTRDIYTYQEENTTFTQLRKLKKILTNIIPNLSNR